MSKTDKNVKQHQRPEQTAKQQIRTEQITKPEIKTEQAQDFFAVYRQNIEKYFENMEASIPKYYQTLTELQQEFLQAWENLFKASITVQKEFASKTGLNLEQSAVASKFVSDTTESAIKARTVRDTIALTTMDTAKDNIKEWNKRSQEFAELNRKIMQSWVSSFTTKQS